MILSQLWSSFWSDNWSDGQIEALDALDDTNNAYGGDIGFIMGNELDVYEVDDDVVASTGGEPEPEPANLGGRD